MNARRVLLWMSLGWLLAATAWAATPGTTDTGPARKARRLRGEVVDNGQRIDINNISMVVTNTGSFAYDKLAGNSGLEFPQGTGKTAVFAAGLWVGAKVGGLVRTAVSEYSDEYGPGSAVGGVPEADSPALKTYKLNRVYATTAARDAALLDYNTGAVPRGAPAVTVQSDGTLNILGDQMLWAVYNDLDPANHTNRASTGGNTPLGIEVQQTTFAFNAQGALGNTIFIKYKFINRGSNQLNEMYVSQWSDPDLGGFTDDLVGSDIGRSVGFVYNATNNDQQYGATPPSVGYDFFQGPSVNGTPLPMASFNKYINGTDPNTAAKTYNYMKGLDASGSPIVDPVTGLITTFQVPGDPVTGTGWLDTNPADRRLMLSAGPFSMAPGESQEVVTGIVIGQSANRLASIAKMKFFDGVAQSAFDQNFQIVPAPNPPVVVATAQDGAVQLSWDNSSESYNHPPYLWEGYVVYQSASVSVTGPWTRVATFDRNDGITTVLDADFDDVALIAVPKVVEIGNDGGTQYSIRLTSDAVRGGPLFNGMTYYYSVNAYSVGVGQTPQAKESAFAPIAVVPQTPPGGTDLSTAAIASGPTYGQYVSGLAPTTDNVQLSIVDPDKVIDATYKLGYKPDAGGIPGYYVVRTVGSVNDTLFGGLSNFTGDASYPVFDGQQIKVIGAPYKTLLDAFYVDVGPNPPGLVGNPDIGGGFFDGSADYTINLVATGSALDPLVDVSPFNNVEIRFTGGPAGQKAYRYMRCNCSPRNYNYQDFVDVPFTVWDIDNNRQLNVGFIENFPNANGVWDPDTLNTPVDDRQWLSVYTSTYSATPLAQYQVDWLAEGANLDMMYSLWPAGSTNPLTIDNGDKFEFQLASRSPNDYFTWTTRAANRNNVSLARNVMQRIMAVPNPYFAHSSYELDQFSRVVKFTHLPQECTIRIFNLAGDLVRTIEKNDNTSQVVWNLETKSGLPVGSGIYIFHVDAPRIGTHVGKVAIFMEKERLNNF